MILPLGLEVIDLALGIIYEITDGDYSNLVGDDCKPPRTIAAPTILLSNRSLSDNPYKISHSQQELGIRRPYRAPFRDYGLSWNLKAAPLFLQQLNELLQFGQIKIGSGPVIHA